jgi:hypothetical protein
VLDIIVLKSAVTIKARINKSWILFSNYISSTARQILFETILE